jgi:hypothetical protein
MIEFLISKISWNKKEVLLDSPCSSCILTPGYNEGGATHPFFTYIDKLGV